MVEDRNIIVEVEEANRGRGKIEFSKEEMDEVIRKLEYY